MKRLITFITVGLVALLSFSSCQITLGEFDNRTIDAELICYYAGGMPAASSKLIYEDVKGHISDRVIEDIFLDLSAVVKPGFTTAELILDVYDWIDEYEGTKVYLFEWIVEDPFTGEGYYGFTEIFE